MTRRAGMTILIALVLAGQALRADISPEVRVRAQRVIELLERAERTQPPSSSRTPPTVTVTESDLNAWIAYRIATEADRYFRACEIRLLAGDRFEGKIVLDLSGTPAAFLLPSETDLYFSAKGESREGKIRIFIEELFLGSQRLSPAVIDKVMALVSAFEGTPPTSLGDWYALPYGIRRLESRKGSLLCHY
jgi:hypothetical protein